MKNVSIAYASVLVGIGVLLSGCVGTPIGGTKQGAYVARAVSGKKTLVGTSSAVKPDCTFHAYPYNHVVQPASHGKVDIEHGIVKGNFAKDSDAFMCSNKPVQGNMIYYTSNPGFVGTDQFTLRVTTLNSNQRVADENVTIKVLK
jgi:hypothetical protein